MVTQAQQARAAAAAANAQLAGSTGVSTNVAYLTGAEAPTKIIPWPGNTRFEADTAILTPAMIKRVQKIVTEVRAVRSKLNQVPMLEGETFEKYSERTASIDPDVIRMKGESVIEHIERLNRPRMDAVEMALPLINRLGSEVFGGQPEISTEEFESIRWMRIKQFIWDVLVESDCLAQEFNPNPKSA